MVHPERQFRIDFDSAIGSGLELVSILHRHDHCSRIQLHWWLEVALIALKHSWQRKCSYREKKKKKKGEEGRLEVKVTKQSLFYAQCRSRGVEECFCSICCKQLPQ